MPDHPATWRIIVMDSTDTERNAVVHVAAVSEKAAKRVARELERALRQEWGGRLVREVAPVGAPSRA